MESTALEEKINKIRLKNEEIRRRHEEVEADKKHAAESDALVKLVPVGDWPERKEPPEFTTAVSTKTYPKAKNVNREQADRSQTYYSGTELKKSHKFAEGDGPPPDPKYNFLADSEREINNSEEKEKYQPRNKPTRGNSKKRGTEGSGRSTFFKDNQRYYKDNRLPEYDAWRAERNKIDQARINRQKTAEGNWRREWDNNKIPIEKNIERKSESNRRDSNNYEKRNYFEDNSNQRYGNQRSYYNSQKNSHRRFYQEQPQDSKWQFDNFSANNENVNFASENNIKTSNQSKFPVMSVKVNAMNIAGTGRVGPRQKSRITYCSQSDVDSNKVFEFNQPTKKLSDEEPSKTYSTEKKFNKKNFFNSKKSERSSSYTHKKSVEKTIHKQNTHYVSKAIKTQTRGKNLALNENYTLLSSEEVSYLKNVSKSHEVSPITNFTMENAIDKSRGLSQCENKNNVFDHLSNENVILENKQVFSNEQILTSENHSIINDTEILAYDENSVDNDYQSKIVKNSQKFNDNETMPGVAVESENCDNHLSFEIDKQENDHEKLDVESLIYAQNTNKNMLTEKLTDNISNTTANKEFSNEVKESENEVKENLACISDLNVDNDFDKNVTSNLTPNNYSCPKEEENVMKIKKVSNDELENVIKEQNLENVTDVLSNTVESINQAVNFEQELTNTLIDKIGSENLIVNKIVEQDPNNFIENDSKNTKQTSEVTNIQKNPKELSEQMIDKIEETKSEVIIDKLSIKMNESEIVEKELNDKVEQNLINENEIIIEKKNEITSTAEYGNNTCLENMENSTDEYQANATNEEKENYVQQENDFKDENKIEIKEFSEKNHDIDNVLKLNEENLDSTILKRTCESNEKAEIKYEENVKEPEKIPENKIKNTPETDNIEDMKVISIDQELKIKDVQEISIVSSEKIEVNNSNLTTPPESKISIVDNESASIEENKFNNETDCDILLNKSPEKELKNLDEKNLITAKENCDERLDNCDIEKKPTVDFEFCNKANLSNNFNENENLSSTTKVEEIENSLDKSITAKEESIDNKVNLLINNQSTEIIKEVEND